jgi:hypothetical protein
MSIFSFLDKKKKDLEKTASDVGGGIFNFLKGAGNVANATGNAVGGYLNKDGKFLGRLDDFVPGFKEGTDAINAPGATVGDFIKAISNTGVQNSPIGAADRTAARAVASITGGPSGTLFGSGDNAQQNPIQQTLANAQGVGDKGLAIAGILGDVLGAKDLGPATATAGKATAKTIAAENARLGEAGYLGGTKAQGFEDALKQNAVTKGVDGNLKFEVDDSQATFTPQNLKRGQATLPEILDHPHLYEDYPQLNGINVKVTDSLEPKQNGYLDRNTNTIVLNGKKDTSKQFETLLHETQHAIQTVEGHASGGSPEAVGQLAQDALTSPYDAYRRLAGEAEARNVANRKDLTLEQRQAQPFNTTFDVKPQDQIVHYDNGAPASLERPTYSNDTGVDVADQAKQKAEAALTPTPQEAPKTPATDKLIAALGQAKPAQEDIAKAQSQALAARSQAGEKLLAGGQGEDAFKRAKAALQGPLVSGKPTIKSQLDQNDLNDLFGQIKDHPQLRFFEKVRAYDALNKVFNGEVPQKNEIGLLEDVFGTKVAKAVVDSTKTKGQKVREGLTSLANVPRAIMSSFDFSAPFRQGLVLTVNHPVSALKAGGQMFKATFSPKVYSQWLEDYKASPEYGRSRDAGLYVADARHSIGDKEEAFMSSIAEKIPVLGSIVKAGERGYNSYLNKIRVDTFNNLADRYEASGVGGEQNIKSLAKFINTATGRGNLGKLEKIAPELNAVFFAPRNMAARLNMLNPAWYVGLKGPAKKEAIKSAGVVLATGLTTLGIAKAAGAEVNDDPRSTDFGKIKVGDTRYDIWGGFQQYARVATQMLTGEKNVGGEIAPADRLDTATKFVRSKLAPIPASVTDIAEGTDYVGQPVTVGSLAKKNLLPFGVQDSLGSDVNPATNLPSIFGFGVQNYSASSSGSRGNSGGGRGSGSSGGRGGNTGGRGR